jgi:hypothetical protein
MDAAFAVTFVVDSTTAASSLAVSTDAVCANAGGVHSNDVTAAEIKVINVAGRAIRERAVVDFSKREFSLSTLPIAIFFFCC